MSSLNLPGIQDHQMQRIKVVVDDLFLSRAGHQIPKYHRAPAEVGHSFKTLPEAGNR